MQRVREMSTKTKQAAQKSVKSNNASKAPAPAVVPVPAAAPVESKETPLTTKQKRATFVSKAQNVGAFVTLGAGADVLGGRIGSRTHAIHTVLLAAAQAGALLTTKEITANATSVLGAPCNATASHLNTMKERMLLTRENGAWRLTDAALKLCSTVWGQDLLSDGAPIKKTKKTKTEKK